MKLRLLTLSSLRFYRRHPWQLLLAVLGIALGVAVFLGIERANGSARRAFDASSTAALDQTTHRLLPVAGRLPVARYLALKRDRRFVDSAPVLELPVTLALPGRPAFDLTLEGIDPIEETAVRGLRGALRVRDPERLLTEPGAILIPESSAARFGIAAGATLALRAGGRERAVTVGGSVDADGPGPPRLVADIATVQELALASKLLKIQSISPFGPPTKPSNDRFILRISFLMASPPFVASHRNDERGPPEPTSHRAAVEFDHRKLGRVDPLQAAHVDIGRPLRPVAGILGIGVHAAGLAEAVRDGAGVEGVGADARAGQRGLLA